MSDVAAYHVFVCALFPVQGGMWRGTASPANNILFSSVIFHDLKILQFDASNTRTVKLYTPTTWWSLQNCMPLAPLL